MWIARDEDGYLYLYEREPIREIDYFYSSYVYFEVDKNLFPKATWENSPQEVKLVLPTTAFDRGRKDSIIKGLKKLEEDYMLSYTEEIDWLNKLVD